MLTEVPIAELIRLHQPLPWNVLDRNGRLLLSKGYVPTDLRMLEALGRRGVYVSEHDYEEFVHEQARNAEAEEEKYSVFTQWRRLHEDIAQLLRRYQQDPEFIDKLTQASGALLKACDHDADASLFSLMRLDKTNYPATHALQTAGVCALFSARQQWSESARMSLVKAALTMNIAMLDLQQVLAKQIEPPTPAQRELIRAHPVQSRESLTALGVSDADWLRAVGEHHESNDGRGYPQGHSAVAPMAEMIHLSDAYCAMLSLRGPKLAMPPNLAAKELYTNAGGAQATAMALVKEMGLYPPGHFVRLANGETGVVVHRGEQPGTPLVRSVLTPKGTAFHDPELRDTANPLMAIVRHLTPEEAGVEIQAERVYDTRE